MTLVRMLDFKVSPDFRPGILERRKGGRCVGWTLTDPPTSVGGFVGVLVEDSDASAEVQGSSARLRSYAEQVFDKPLCAP